MIAAFLGNVVGALLVAIPYTYFYLSDYLPAGNLRTVEEGEGFNQTVMVRESNSDNGKSSEENLKKRED